jgi:hypothetical protein
VDALQFDIGAAIGSQRRLMSHAHCEGQQQKAAMA